MGHELSGIADVVVDTMASLFFFVEEDGWFSVEAFLREIFEAETAKMETEAVEAGDVEETEIWGIEAVVGFFLLVELCKG